MEIDKSKKQIGIWIWLSPFFGCDQRITDWRTTTLIEQNLGIFGLVGTVSWALPSESETNPQRQTCGTFHLQPTSSENVTQNCELQNIVFIGSLPIQL